MLFSWIVGILFPLTENFISLQFPFSNDRLRHFEGFIFIAAHLKSSWRQVTICSMYDLDSAIRVTSFIKTFVDGPVIWLVLISALHNISITIMKSSGEIIQPIMMSIFNFCQLTEYLLLENLTSMFKVHWYEVFNVLWNPKELYFFSSSWCLTAFSRSNQMTWSLVVLLFFAVFIRSHNIVVCSKQPGKPGTPAF